MNPLGIPGVDTVLDQPAVRVLLEELPREVVVACVREIATWPALEPS